MPRHVAVQMSREQRPSQEDDGGEYDRQLSTLLGWLLALMPTFRPRHTVMNLNTLSKMQLYSPEVRVRRCLCQYTCTRAHQLCHALCQRRREFAYSNFRAPFTAMYVLGRHQYQLPCGDMYAGHEWSA